MKKTFKFNSLTEMAEACRGCKHLRRSEDYGVERRVDQGTATREAAFDLLQKGWPEGGSRIREMRVSLESYVEETVAILGEETRFGVDGEWADIGRMLEGHPECMGYDEESESPSRAYKLVANAAVSWQVDRETIFQRGAAIVAAADILEALGHRVEVWVGAGSSGSNWNESKSVQIVTQVKKPQEPVDVDALAFTLCHAAYQRRLMWSFLEDQHIDLSSSRPMPLWGQDGVVLPELVSGRVSTAARKKMVAEICGLCGIKMEELK